jgi:hypothetical protein
MALTPGELLAIQQDSEALLDLTCTINRPTEGTGAWGQDTESFTLIMANVPCMVGEPPAQLLTVHGGLLVAQEATYTIQVPVPSRGGPDVRENDQCIVTDHDGKQITLRVQSVAQPHSYELLREFTAAFTA